MPSSLRHQYYYARLNQAFSFLIAPGKRVLYYGKALPGVIPALSCESLTLVTRQPASELAGLPAGVTLFAEAATDFVPDQTFDVIILNCTVGESPDICGFLQKLARTCTPDTRLVLYQHNYLWQAALNLGGLLGLKERERTQNWLSVSDLSSILSGMGFELLWSHRQTICPLHAGGLGPVLNRASELFFPLDFLMLDQFIVARPGPVLAAPPERPPSLTICLTVRNERDNIAPIVSALPQVCPDQEILFVEGHSTDGTRDEILRVAENHPKKNIRVIGQPGKGQGDAIREGFFDANGEIIILYEGDGTSDPRDIVHFYNAMASRRAEFLEGSRFIYPLDRKSMPFFNKVGNTAFAAFFSFFLGRNVTDVLSGIKAVFKSDFVSIHRTWGFSGVEDPFGDFELLFGAMRYGLKYGEIPMRYKPRPYGESKTKVFRHGLVLLAMALRGYLAFRGLHVGKEEGKKKEKR